jgi:hypothetical protein
MNEIFAYKCGTPVAIKGPCFAGTITGIQIRDGRVTYEVSYFKEGDYISCWFADYEFKPINKQKKVKIGFANQEG